MSYTIAMAAACPYPAPQGSQVLITGTATALRDAGHDVHLVTYGYGVGDPPEGITIHGCANAFGATRLRAGPTFTKPFNDWNLLRTLRKVVRDTNADIIHAHNYEALAISLRVGGCPVVYHAHNLLVDELPHYFGGMRWAARAGRFADKRYPKRASAVIALHDAQAKALKSAGVDSDRIAVVPPPINADVFRSDREYSDHPKIVYTGNLDAYQNLPFLAEVFAYVRKHNHYAECVVATNDPRPVPFATRVDTPDFESIRSVLRDDIILVSPREAESGYPMKILNGMAAGLPVIAVESVCGPIRNGETGFATPANIAEFGDAVLRLMDDPQLRGNIGINAREYVQQHHTPEVIAKQIEHAYEIATRPP